jgi:hypothetical protein
VSDGRDPRDTVEEWSDVSRRAALATGYRSRSLPRTTARTSAVRSLGALAVVVLVVVGGLALRSSSPDTLSGAPVVAAAEDASFRLTLTTPRATYSPADAIDPVAAVTYLGPKTSETMYHAMYPIGFQIEEVGGKRVMGGFMDDPCLSTELTKGKPAEFPFGKAGAGTDDPSAGFNRAWYQDPVLRLPEGTWRIIANLEIDTGQCGGEHHQLTVENVVTVVAGASPSPAEQATPSPTPLATPSLSADAATALEIVRKYLDAVATDHPENAWPMLSTWSHRAVGSFATYVDANRRFGPPAGSQYVVSPPSRDPDLLDPAFLGQRSADIAAAADASTVFVVSVTYPDAVGAALATQNLVAARLSGGDWRIWLDMSPDGYVVSYPDGCRFFDLSNRRCDAVMNAARAALGIDPATVEGIDLLPDQACGGSNRDPDALDICVRTMAFVAGVRFHLANGTTLRQDIFCGPGPSTLVCSENPAIDAIDLHGAGYWDVPCTGEAPNGCPSPIPTPTGAEAEVGRELRIATLDLPVGSKGHREVEIGRAVLVDGIVQDARFSIVDQTQNGFLLDPGVIRMELRSTIAGRPSFDNAYQRGTFRGPEEIRIMLVFDVAETNPDAVIHILDVLVR